MLLLLGFTAVRGSAQASPNIITPDTIPPTVWITPSGGTYSTTNSVPVTISWCDNQGLNSTSRLVLLNGTGITTTYTTGTYTGCTKYATSSATLTLAIGSNTLTASILDNAGNSGQNSAVFRYTPYAVSVTPYNASVTHGTSLIAVRDSFTVHNTGALGATYSLSANCSGAAVSSCTAPTSVTLAAGGSAKVIVTYATGANGTTGSVVLTAKAQPDTTEQGSGSTNVTISAVYGVTVTADSASIARPSRTDGVQSFRVKNTGNSPANYNLTVTCPTTLFSGCSAPNALYLYAGDSASVSVGYTTAIGAASGTLSLQATAQQDGTKSATGNTSVSVTALPAIADATPGAWTALDRAHCLAFEIVRNLAAQCDAFRVTHPLPSVITHGKMRTPTLVYYSDQTLGAGVAANITVASAVDSVQFSVYQRNLDGTISPSPIKSRTYSWANLANSTQRVALSGVFATTGLSRYRLQAKTWTVSAGWQTLGTTDGEIMATYRPSYWGAGWWMGGVEQLTLGQGSTSFPDSIVMWSGGDGSMTKYLWKARIGSQDIYLAANPIDGPDTLVKELIQGPQDTTQWTRRDVNNLRVYFDSYGRHRLTVNRLNDTTRFLWPASNAPRLDSIQVPSRLTYRFYYGANGTRLDSIVAPDAAGIHRVVRTERDTMPNGSLSLSIHRFTDPDGKKITFEWVSGDASGQWYSARTDRRGVRTALTWETSGPGLASASTPDGLGHTATHTFRNAASIGMDPSAAPLSFDSVYTRYDGPRVDSADVTKFWLDPLGDPAKIINAVGQTTIIRHTAAFPGLATEVVAPSGVVTRGWFSSTRGLEDSTAVFSPYGDGRNATTKYAWDGKWNRVVTTTTPEGEVTRDSVDQQSGNVLWVAMGGDTTKFHYDVAGRVDSVLTSDGAYDKYAYDALGNLNWHRRPDGYISAIGRDNIGREVADTTNTENVLPNITKHSYDIAGRDSLSVSYRDNDTLEVRTLYSAEGLPLSVRQRALPKRAAATDGTMIDSVTRSFTYDSLGRKITEAVGGVQINTFTYDEAGNLLNSSRDMGPSRLSYDRLNRPSVRSGGADSTHFTYDAVTGALIKATNANAVVTRSYYPGGALKGDTISIIGPRNTDGGPHGISLTYDRDGRRTQLTLPSEVAGTMQYTYDPRTGQLATITDNNGTTYRYHYDLRGNIDSLIRRENRSDKLIETRSYDGQSKLHERIVPGFLDDVYSYDGLDRITGSSQTTTTYDGLGHVTAANGVLRESFSFDALGNRRTYTASGGHPPTPNYAYSYEPGSGRLALQRDLNTAHNDSTWYSYNWGNLTQTDHHAWFSAPSSCGSQVNDSGYVQTSRTNYYGFDNKIVQTSFTYDTVWALRCQPKPDSAYTTQETYGYDPLGRRVWERVVYGTACAFFDPSTGCSSTITSTVWDGSAILMESRQRADTGAMQSTGDAGTVVYVNGSELDKPLAVIKPSAHDVLPVPNWRGVITAGGCPTTLCNTGDVSFAQSNGAIYGGPGYPKLSPNYFGSLIQGMQDQSGYIYQRNRYLNPSTGQFTQEDPIGLAGGLNVYGFGNGDPVSYSDPFGLCPPKDDTPCTGDSDMSGAFLYAARMLKPVETPLKVGTVLATLPLTASGEAAILTLGLAGKGAQAAEEMATFYRGIDATEAADFAEHGVLRASPNGNMGKYLTNTVEAATQWAGKNGAQVLRVRVPADALKAFQPLGRIDGIGEAWWAPMESLSGARVDVLKNLLVPK